MHYQRIPCNTMQYHAIPCNTMQYHAIPCSNMQYPASPWNTMQIHAIPCNTKQCHAIPCNTMQYHAIPCNTMQYHACLLSADGAYHCPVGSIWPFFCYTYPLQSASEFGNRTICHQKNLSMVPAQILPGSLSWPRPSSSSWTTQPHRLQGSEKDFWRSQPILSYFYYWLRLVKQRGSLHTLSLWSPCNWYKLHTNNTHRRHQIFAFFTTNLFQYCVF